MDSCSFFQFNWPIKYHVELDFSLFLETDTDSKKGCLCVYPWICAYCSAYSIWNRINRRGTRSFQFSSSYFLSLFSSLFVRVKFLNERNVFIRFFFFFLSGFCSFYCIFSVMYVDISNWDRSYTSHGLFRNEI